MDELIASKLDSFFSKYKHQVYRKGEILVRADDEPPGIFYLKKGYVKQYAISPKGDELIVNVFKPISFFPMSWVINGTKNEYFYEAMTDVDIWRASKEDVTFFIKSNPDVLFDLMGRVYKGIDGLLTRMTYLMSGNAYERLIIELLIYVKRFGNDKNIVKLRISEKDLAAQAGLTRETVSREIKTLKKKELVTFKNNQLIVIDISKLREELST